MWLKIYTSEPGPLVSLTLKSADWREAKSRAMTKSSLLWEALTDILRQTITIRWFMGEICRESCKRTGLTHTIHEEMFAAYQSMDQEIAVCEVDGSFFLPVFIQRIRNHRPQHRWQDLPSNVKQAKTAHKMPATGKSRAFCWDQSIMRFGEHGNREMYFGIALSPALFGLETWKMGHRSFNVSVSRH